jgi:hypothetical protein
MDPGLDRPGARKALQVSLDTIGPVERSNTSRALVPYQRSRLVTLVASKQFRRGMPLRSASNMSGVSYCANYRIGNQQSEPTQVLLRERVQVRSFDRTVGLLSHTLSGPRGNRMPERHRLTARQGLVVRYKGLSWHHMLKHR